MLGRRCVPASGRTDRRTPSRLVPGAEGKAQPYLRHPPSKGPPRLESYLAGDPNTQARRDRARPGHGESPQVRLTLACKLKG